MIELVVFKVVHKKEQTVATSFVSIFGAKLAGCVVAPALPQRSAVNQAVWVAACRLFCQI